MSAQSLFEFPGPVGQAGGVLEQKVEGQKQLRGELGLVAEWLDKVERAETGAKAAVGELERRSEAS